MMLADASNEFTGQWVLVAIAVTLGVAALLGIFAYFATAREVQQLSKAIDDLNEANERRAVDLHNRLNPLGERVSMVEGETKAFNSAFEKFTRIIESTGRSNDDTLKAFTRSLDTFASVVDRNSRRTS